MAQFIAILKRNVADFPPEAFTPEIMEAEAERARALYGDGINRALWSRLDYPGAVALMEAGSAEEALASLASLPLMQRGMLAVELLVPVGPYRGFLPRS
jgi:muconolactone delta-isomerase